MPDAAEVLPTDTLIVVYSCPAVTLNYLLSKVVSKQSRWWVGLQAENYTKASAWEWG